MKNHCCTKLLGLCSHLAFGKINEIKLSQINVKWHDRLREAIHWFFKIQLLLNPIPRRTASQFLAAFQLSGPCTACFCWDKITCFVAVFIAVASLPPSSVFEFSVGVECLCVRYVLGVGVGYRFFVYLMRQHKFKKTSYGESSLLTNFLPTSTAAAAAFYLSCNGKTHATDLSFFIKGWWKVFLCETIVVAVARFFAPRRSKSKSQGRNHPLLRYVSLSWLARKNKILVRTMLSASTDQNLIKFWSSSFSVSMLDESIFRTFD